MKNLVSLIVTTCFAININAQSTVEAFISKASDIALKQCNVTRQEVSNFSQEISILTEELDKKMEKLSEEARAYEEKNEKILEKNADKKVTEEYGISKENMAKLKGNEKMSESDKEALINDALKKQGNMNLADAEKLSQMSEKEQQKYAEQYVANKMQKQETSPVAQKSMNNSEKLGKLISKQKTLTEKIQADNHRIEKLYTDFENDKVVRDKMFDNISKWQTEWYSLSGIDYGQGPKMEKLSQQIKEEKIKICDTYTPRYQDILNQHLSMIKSSIQDVRALEQVTYEITNMAIGIKSSPSDTESTGLNMVRDYLRKLSAAYYYKLYFPEDDQ